MTKRTIADATINHSKERERERERAIAGYTTTAATKKYINNIEHYIL